MTIRDAEAPLQARAQARASRLRFGRYVLDLDRGCLVLEGHDVALRPKTFAVLRYLIENSGRLVSKDELFAAVWPNLAITDDALVQSIGELRRALGEDGPNLIKTVPRRGYRFEAEVSDAPVGAPAASGHATPAAAGIAPHVPPSARRPLVGRRAAALAAVLAVLLAAGAALWLWTASGRLVAERPATTADARAAIAVLPFANTNEDASREYFSDGLTQDIINALGRFSALTVMSWNAVLPYKAKPASPAGLSRDLAVRYVVEGSVRVTGERVRVTTQLVDAAGRVLWTARFDEALADLFALQDKIATEITGALAIRITQNEQNRALAKPTKSLEAYDYVLRARPALRHPGRATTVEARALLRRAIELDPNYAAAYAALGETFYNAVSMGWAESPMAFIGQAEEMAHKALALDDADVRARIILSRIHIFHQRYEQAKAEIDRALAVNPNDASGIAGRGNILMWLGQTDAAIENLEQAQRLDPDLVPMDRFALSLAYYLKRRYDAAVAQAELNLRRSESASFSRIVLAAAYAQQDRQEDAARAAALVRRVDPTFDPQGFGSKFLDPADLEHLRVGFRKAGLYETAAVPPASNN